MLDPSLHLKFSRKTRLDPAAGAFDLTVSLFQGGSRVTLWWTKIPIEHGPFIVDLPIKNGDFQ